MALEGKLLTDSTNAGGQVEKESEKLGQEDLLVLEDQLDNMLDFEPESDNDEEENSSKEKKKIDEKAEESGDDEIMLIEEVKFDETESKKGSNVEKILKGSLDSIPPPSPLVKIQIMDKKVCLRHKSKTLLGIVNKFFVFKSLLTTSSNVLPLRLSRP